jgi:hypothetical protein
VARGVRQQEPRSRYHGRAVQFDPIKPTLKAPGSKRLKLKLEELLSNFAFKFDLRRYIMTRVAARWSKRTMARGFHRWNRMAAAGKQRW